MSTSFVRLGGGMTMSLSCSIRAYYGSVGTVFALLQAEISKNLFESYHNIDSLAQKFPDRVKMVNDLVQISGPVLITDGVFAFAIPLVFSAATTAIVAFVIYKIIDVSLNIFSYKKSEEELPERYKNVIIITSVMTFVASSIFFLVRIPSEPGVHLLDWSFKKNN